MLTAAPAGSGAEQSKSGGFAQVLALLPAASTKPAPAMDPAMPAPVGEAMLPAANPVLPESGKILPGALPHISAPQLPSAIPAGIMAILPSPPERPVSPAPASVPTQPVAAVVQLKSALTKAPQAEPVQEQEEPVPATGESKAQLVRHADTNTDRVALSRSAVAPSARKAPATVAAIEAPLRKERASEQVLRVSVNAQHEQPIVLEAEALVSLPVVPPQASEPSAPVEAPDAPAPSVVTAPTATPISQAKAQLPDGPLRQQSRTDQQISAPAEPARAYPQPAANTLKVELPVASLTPLRASPVPAAALVIVPDAAIPADLTIAMPLRAAFPRRAAVVPIEHAGSPTALTNFSAPSEPLPHTSPVAVQRQTDESATAPAQMLSTPAAPPSITAPDISNITASAAERPADFTQIVDRLIAARDAAGSGTAQPVHVSLSHAEFGKVSLRFSHDDGALSVAMSSADPAFARAAQIAAPSQPAAADANTGGSSNQPQSRAGDGPALTSNGQSQAGSSGSSGQRQSAPEFRPARGEPARQPANSDNEPAADRRHRFA